MKALINIFIEKGAPIKESDLTFYGEDYNQTVTALYKLSANGLIEKVGTDFWQVTERAKTDPIVTGEVYDLDMEPLLSGHKLSGMVTSLGEIPESKCYPSRSTFSLSDMGKIIKLMTHGPIDIRTLIWNVYGKDVDTPELIKKANDSILSLMEELVATNLAMVDRDGKYSIK